MLQRSQAMGLAWRRLEYKLGLLGCEGDRLCLKEVKFISGTNEKLPLKKGTGGRPYSLQHNPGLQTPLRTPTVTESRLQFDYALHTEFLWK